MKHWYAIRYLEWYQTGYTNPVGPVLVRADTIPGIVYWRFGPAHMLLTSEQKPEILKDYGPARSSNDPYRRFFRDFPIESSLENNNTDGWLSPQGEYYPVGFGQHTWTAEQLFAQKRYLPIVEQDFEDELYKRGWIAIHGGSNYISRDHTLKVKPKQRERIRQMISHNPNLENLERYLE